MEPIIVLVKGFEVHILQTDQGIVVDIWKPNGEESISSASALDSELHEDTEL